MNLSNHSSMSVKPEVDVPHSPEPQLLKVAVALAILTLFIFYPVVGYTFINYDDDIFITNNPKVAAGFTWEGVRWAFTSAEIDYWRPLSWLSHMLDMELFGPVGGGHHLTSLLIHVAASVMVLLAMHRLTHALWPSAIVAALFAWHPLHVESVAWIGERKDVLCGFFWFFTVWAYARFAANPTPRHYCPVLVGFLLGAMSKPMIMTLPCALLLLDYWPLRRPEMVRLVERQSWYLPALFKDFWAAVKDKVPMFVVVICLGLSTVEAQHEAGAVWEVPLPIRVANGIAAYGTYLRQTFWPVDLCVLYQLKPSLFLIKFGIGLFLCFTLTVVAITFLRRMPFLMVGWLWFLGTLFPVLGVVRQVGEQSHADRYTYIPLVGIFLLFVWTSFFKSQNQAQRNRLIMVVWSAVLITCAILTRHQLRFWEDSIAMFTRATQVDPTNDTALMNLGAEFIAIGDVDAARPHLEVAVVHARRPGTLWNLAVCLMARGEWREAQKLTREAMTPIPDDTSQKRLRQIVKAYGELILSQPTLTTNQLSDSKHIYERLAGNKAEVLKILATAAASQLDYSEAVQHLTLALEHNNKDVSVQIDRAAFLAVLGKDQEAIVQLTAAVALAPANAVAQSNLAALLAKQRRLTEAIEHYRLALKSDPRNADTHHNFALALSRNRQPEEAIREFQIALELNPSHQPALQQLAWLLATNQDKRDPRRALLLAEQAVKMKRTATSLDTLAAALAANQDFVRAAAMAMEALTIARQSKLALESAIRERLDFYRKGLQYSE